MYNIYMYVYMYIYIYMYKIFIFTALRGLCFIALFAQYYSADLSPLRQHCDGGKNGDAYKEESSDVMPIMPRQRCTRENNTWDDFVIYPITTQQIFFRGFDENWWICQVTVGVLRKVIKGNFEVKNFLPRYLSFKIFQKVFRINATF